MAYGWMTGLGMLIEWAGNAHWTAGPLTPRELLGTGNRCGSGRGRRLPGRWKAAVPIRPTKEGSASGR